MRDYTMGEPDLQSVAMARLWKATADRLAERVEVLEAALQQAYQCCARPSGVCFDPALIDGSACEPDPHTTP